MMRAVIELVFAVVILFVARAVLSTVLKGLSNLNNVSSNSGPRQPPPPNSDPMPPGRELHKDPVCGTYVADTTPHRKQIGASTLYFCSEDCLHRHAAARR